MLTAPTSPISKDRGATAVVIAATLLVLIGIAAIATDVGAGFSERRQAQSAADVSVMAGALWSTISSHVNPLQDAVNQAKLVAAANTSTLLDWGNCTDLESLHWQSNNPLFDPATADPGVAINGGTECISFSQGFTTMRVKVPDQSIDTTFARVLGTSELLTNAAAEASIFSLGLSGSFPSGVLGGAGAGTQFCIKTGPNDNESCGAPSTGDFQNFRPYFYTEIDVSQNPTTYCTSGEQTEPMSRAMAEGIDHFFGIAPGLDLGVRINGDSCPTAALPVFPDKVDSAAGYQNTDITNGLVLGGDYDGVFAGRLDRGPYQSTPIGSSTGFEIFETTIDNRPLWDFINPTLTTEEHCVAVATLPPNPSFAGMASYTVPSNSYETTLETWDEANELLSRCLANESSPLFDEDDLLQSPRLAAVPQFWEATALPSNSCCYDIQEFVPIFINSVWTAHSNQWTCDGEVVWVDGDLCRHDPGMTGQISVTAPGQKRVDSASAWILKCAHFAPETCSVIENGAGAPTSILTRVELTR